MLVFEPIIACWGKGVGDEPAWIGRCEDHEHGMTTYSFFAMIAMFIFFVLCLDLSVLFTRISAYVLVCSRMVSEVHLFLLAIFSLILSFGSALGSLNQDNADFHGLHKASLALLKMILREYSTADYARLEGDWIVLLAILTFLIASLIFLTNLLVAQLSCAYAAIYDDMVGYARLIRIRIISETLASVKKDRWDAFVKSLKFHRKLEFNEGDVGLPGGVSTTEPASQNPLTVDCIRRFGGSTSPSNPWPEEGNATGDRYENIEKLCSKALQKLGKGGSGSLLGFSHGGSQSEGSQRGHDNASQGSGGVESEGQQSGRSYEDE
jgi:hypothetical protein